MNKLYFPGILLIVLSLTFSLNAQVTVYNNFGSGHDGWDYNYGFGWTIAGDDVGAQFGVQQAMGFEPSEGGFVTDIWVAISYVPSSSPADTVIIRLASNPNGQPPDEVNILEEWMLTDFDNWYQWNEPIHLVAGNTTMINPGNEYWLWALAKETTYTMWCMNENSSFTCPHTLKREGEDWLSISNETASAFRVDVSTGVGISSNDDLPGQYVLSQNYPNPFTNSTSITYTLPESCVCELKIIDMYGREIKSVFNGFQQNGKYNMDLNIQDLNPGIYFCKLIADGTLVGVRKLNCVR